VCHGEGRIADVEVSHPDLAPALNVEITAVTDTGDGLLEVAFTLTDEDGNGVAGIALGGNRFYISDIVPAGTATSWGTWDTAYLERWAYERDRSGFPLGTWTEIGGGDYTYTFATAVGSEEALEQAPDYDPSHTQRVVLRIDGRDYGYNRTVGIQDFLVDGTLVEPERVLAPADGCMKCHSPAMANAAHAGGYLDTRVCVQCHSPIGTAYGDEMQESGAWFTNLIHKIHAAIPMEAFPDRIDGRGYGAVTYPQDVRNCTTCHTGSDNMTEAWNSNPTAEACGSCHEDVNFETGEGHSDLNLPQPDNMNCASCHPSEGSSAAVIEAHLTENSTPNNPGVPDGLVNFEYVLEEVTVNESNEAVVTFHINKDGEPLDMSTYPPEGFNRGPVFLLAYTLPQDGINVPIDYNNGGRTAGQPLSVSLEDVAGDLQGTADSYTVTLAGAPYPEGAVMRAVALQGYFNQEVGDDDVGRHTPSVVMAVTDDDVRRVIVEVPKCLNCHEIIEGHGGNRVNEVLVCVLCHNPNLSSSGRTADTTQTDPEEKEKIEEAGYDPDDALTWPEATNNFKDMIHGIHAADVRNFDYEFVRNRRNGIYYNWSEVTFPGILSLCETCP
jgi:OmcA/MtrC family decaheme c-type cytochrome